MGCFSTACFGSWKHKKTFKKLHNQPLSPSDQLHEAVTLLGAATESPKEEEPVSEFDLAKSEEEEQINCKTDSISNCDKLVENENGNLSSRIQEILISDKEVESESSESLFSLSIDSRKQVFTADMGDKEVTSPLKTNNNNNTSIGSTKSARLMDKLSSLKFDENNKENVGLEPLLKQSLVKTAVDDTTTSLSGWLNLSQKSNIGKSNSNSPESEKNYGPTAELKQMNGGDGQLGIGTVGRYWQETGPARACLAEILQKV